MDIFERSDKIIEQIQVTTSSAYYDAFKYLLDKFDYVYVSDILSKEKFSFNETKEEKLIDFEIPYIRYRCNFFADLVAKLLCEMWIYIPLENTDNFVEVFLQF